ncbi:hypothetical protein HO173_000640 [Letharia columbiana]|uniref:Triosephosphate isomerase n=1 Tax=Letharia columbiana TaxID=112416 RepID=A0A8H6G5G3_9LECA|nr:uncharacterized protein HO173_000640 [Letharia columbiana]KAF6240848.1 hypothetical protein HO173_000640 [Letharia columbiana]
MKPPILPKRLVGVNLKMYFDAPSTTAYITAIAKFVAPPASISTGIFILPSYPCLASASDLLDMTPQVILGAQNCHAEDSGAYTGEISPLMLKQVGCRIVCLGHAERRRAPFNETDEVVATKAEAVVRNGMIPLVCIGEKSRSGIMSEGVGIAVRECSPQVMSVLRAVPGDAPIIFAYEPVWAIGAQEPASADHVLAVVKSLKQLIGTVEERADVRILYGGSAKPGTWGTLKEGVDGLFLGRFAHDVGNFERVVREVEES